MALIVVFALVVNSRDDNATSSQAEAPGRPGRAPTAAHRELVADGNVVVLHGSADRAALGTLVQEITGLTPGDRQRPLLRAGQGVELAGGRGAIEAYGGDRVLRANGPDDPQLRRFLEFWLGRTLGG